MKRHVTLILLCICLLLCAVGCTPNTPEGTTPPATTPSTIPTTAPQDTTPPDPRELYHQYTQKIGTDIAMDITLIYETDIAGSRFISSSQQQITYWGLGSDSFSATVDESVSFGEHTVKYSEVFSDGIAYAVITGEKFSSEQTAEEFTARYLPVIILDESLYETVLLNGSTFSFSDPTALEAWLLDEEVEITEAEGKVTITGDSIASAYYTVTYTVGGADITVTAQQTFSPAAGTVKAPADPDAYRETESIDAIKLLDNAFGYLNQAEQFSSSTLISTQSQAAGLIVNSQCYLNSYVTEKGTDYFVETNVYAQDSTDTLKQNMQERFISGKYSVQVDDGEESYNSAVTAGIMESYVLDTLSSNILDTQYLTGASIIDLGSLYFVEYTCSEELARVICEAFSETYLGQADLLESIATKYQTNKMEYYLALDKYTMLPTACGYLYEGCHTIEGYDCLLIEQADQSFDLASMTSHDAIYEEPSPDIVPQEKATPLFYRVTGADGQEMWLFGTIHVGDDRTAFLPQEIYDALLSSDALAVECDTEGFNEAVEEDETLQNQVSDCYFYNDGTIADHLDTEDLHEYAVKVMKATGSYFYNSEYQKASLWSNAIDNYYLSQGHQLLSEKGLESRLEKLAAANDIPLWEVESSLFQIKMMTGYSDHLQEFQLYSSAYSHGRDSWESTAELYELWCSGDEAKLIEEMKREVWAFTEEDLEETEDMDEDDLKDLQYIRENKDSINRQLADIYEEYIKAMESDRNAGMLEVAKDYLESGDTVFFAVGLAHLLAEDGLVFTLRDAGYTVELVEYN